jgi:hypothetical protein
MIVAKCFNVAALVAVAANFYGWEPGLLLAVIFLGNAQVWSWD